MNDTPNPFPLRSLPEVEDALPHDQVAALWEVARLANEDLELKPMLQRITDRLARRFGWELVSLVRVLPDEGRFECQAVTTSLPTVVRPGYTRELGSGVVGQVALSGESIVLDDVSEFPGFIETQSRTVSEICVPVRHQGEVVAVLNAESTESARFRDQRVLFEALAEQIAGAVARGLLYEQVRQRSEFLETLNEVSRRVVDGRELQERLDDLVAYLRHRFRLRLAAVMVADDEGRYWQERAIATEDELAIHRTQWPIDAGVVGRAVTRGETVRVADTSTDPDYISVDDRVRTELVVPLRSGGRVLGALNMEAEDPSLLVPETVRTFEAIGHQLAGAIELAVSHRRLAESERELARANEELSRLTLVDELTGVANRRRLNQCLEDETRRARRHGEPVTLALFDVDFFKAYNDEYGHPAGDECLRRVAECLLEKAVRAGELVARYGGEEFALVMPRLGLAEAALFIEQTRLAVSDLAIEHLRSDVSSVLTLSAGVASVVPSDDEDVDQLLARADEALYRAKREGRDRTAI